MNISNIVSPFYFKDCLAKIPGEGLAYLWPSGYQTIIDSYSARFQIEFNFRDAKQFWGLEDFTHSGTMYKCEKNSGS